MTVTTRLVSPRHADAIRLLALLTEEIRQMYADRGEDGSGGFEIEDAEQPGSAFIVAYVDDQAIGCGALRRHDPAAGEVKRMFVLPEYRGRGIAMTILAAIEQEAVRAGYRVMRLETGDRQPNAVRVYERAGYRRSAPYGVYVNWVGSLCFIKDLDTPS